MATGIRLWAVPSRSIAPSPAVAGLLRRRREALGLTLRAVAKLAAEAGNPIPYSTLARIEQGVLDPGVKRLQQLLRLYHVPLQAAGDLLDLEDMADELPTETEPKALYQSAVDAWKGGEIRRALASLFAFRARTEGDDAALRHKATLAFAVTASSLGKHRLSKHLVDELLAADVGEDLLVPLLLQAAVAWHWLGGVEAALAFLARAESRIRPGADQQRGWVHHERAVILMSRREFTPAASSLRQALRAFRSAKDEHGYGRALGTGVRLHLDQGDGSAALRAAQAARFHAARHRLHRLAMHRSIDEGRALAMLQDLPRAIRTLEKALADAIQRDDRAAQFYVHFYLWDVLSRSGESERARLEFEAAAFHLSSTDAVTPETQRMRELLARSGRARQGTVPSIE